LISGLVEMHKKRIIHRDLKPENLIFRSVGTNDIVIADYGLATWADASEYIFVRCGTPGYVAPEIINYKARNGQDPISDVFSLGIIAHILATGRSPFPGREYNEVLA
jgi:serine/threonine protein kinase